ncbi:MAG: hypothetical protein J4G05_06570 [Chlorobi bacterium]|nr:hypothetical protein [Chlorobiota bacterium]
MDILEALRSLPAILKIALPILLIFLIGAIVKKLVKYIIIIALLIGAILFIYPLFDY